MDDPLIAFVDVDYLRASGAFGRRRVTTREPETWLVERVGIIWATMNGENIEVVDAQLVGGSTPVTDAIRALGRASLVVGCGLLTSDLRAFGMVAPIPERLIDRTVDIMLDLYDFSGQRYPTGLNLTDLSALNAAEHRLKPHDPSPVVAAMRSGLRGHRGNFNPLDDAMSAARVWSALLQTRRARWGGRRAGWAGDTESEAAWVQTDTRTRLLDETTVRRLMGQDRLGAQEWRERLRRRGTVFTRTPVDPAAAALACEGQHLADLDLDMLRRCVDALPGDAQTVSDEQLMAAFHLLGPAANLAARQRLREGRFLASRRRLAAYMFALWHTCHLDTMLRWREVRAATWASGDDIVAHQEVMRESGAIEAACAKAAGRLCTRKPSTPRKTPLILPQSYAERPGSQVYTVGPDGRVIQISGPPAAEKARREPSPPIAPGVSPLPEN